MVHAQAGQPRHLSQRIVQRLCGWHFLVCCIPATRLYIPQPSPPQHLCIGEQRTSHKQLCRCQHAASVAHSKPTGRRPQPAGFSK